MATYVYDQHSDNNPYPPERACSRCGLVESDRRDLCSGGRWVEVES